MRRRQSNSATPRARNNPLNTTSRSFEKYLPVARNNPIPTRKLSRRVVRGYASNASLASATAINAPTSVPGPYRELHQRLVALQESASSYVDLARLQLAARSLEGDNLVTRVVFLGIGGDGQIAARKLARVLLSDALADEEAWEAEIMDSIQDGRSLLLRYGDAEDPVDHNPLVKTMNIPSPYLRRHKVEILVSGLNVGNGSSNGQSIASLRDAILVPSLTTPNSAGGRVGFVRYPVHKAILIAEGITGAVQYGRLPATLADGTLITTALSVPLRPASNTVSAEAEASTDSIDIDLATHALNLFRASNTNGAQFSQEWQTSRVSDVGKWAATSEEETSSGLNPAVSNLITSVLSDTKDSITRAEATSETSTTLSTVSESKRQVLQSTISNWSAESHRDLQSNLDIAFTDSPSWRRTTWWRLFWRIDDVTVSASDVLYRSWLTESEQMVAFVSGCIAEAGLATREQLRSTTPQILGADHEKTLAVHERSRVRKDREETVAELTQLPSMLARMQRDSGVNPQFSPPWPQTINLSRQYMIHTLVPDLHRKAQALLLTAASTIGGSAALGGWFYFATRGLGLYESGAIFALGLVFALRRLQTKWGRERDGFAVAVREDARRVLGEVETHLRKLVSDGGRTTVQVADSQSWQEAREAVARCQTALESIKKSS